MKQWWYYYIVDQSQIHTLIERYECICPDRTKIYSKLLDRLQNESDIRCIGYCDEQRYNELRSFYKWSENI